MLKIKQEDRKALKPSPDTKATLFTFTHINLVRIYILVHKISFDHKTEVKVTRAAVDGTPSQIPAFFTYNLFLRVKVTQNVAQYLLHNVTYAPVKFEVDMSNG